MQEAIVDMSIAGDAQYVNPNNLHSFFEESPGLVDRWDILETSLVDR